MTRAPAVFVRLRGKIPSTPLSHPRPRSGIQMSESECLWIQRNIAVPRVRGLWILNQVEDDGWAVEDDGGHLKDDDFTPRHPRPLSLIHI